MRTTACSLLLLFVATLSVGCSNAYYGTMEAFGVHKRDILVDRVTDARDEQTEAKEQFESALEEFMAVVGYQGGELEAQYDKLNSAYKASKDEAEDVSERIESIEGVAEALFAEWEAELEQYKSSELRRSSEAQLRQTRLRYEDLMRVMRRAESRMQPVLDAFQDQVLYLKHNLNARAIASLQDTSLQLEQHIQDLVEEMQRSIEEANAFIATMEAE